MRVHPSQLIEGCILLEDVKGKSGRPIMEEGTILTEELITVLDKFLIDSVDVSTKLHDGKTFLPKRKLEPNEKKSEHQMEIYLEPEENRSIPEHYLQAVKDYKGFFDDWRNGVPLDMPKIRKSVIPLLERVDELDMDIFTIYQLGTAEDYIYHHGVAVSLLSAYLGKELGYRKGEWIQIGLAGYLADAGMSKVDPEILTKGGPLTEDQLADIKNHPTYSYRMVGDVTGLSQQAKIAVLQHHERLDGSGYPLGLSKDKINSYARIIAISDTYHAMTSERFYKKKQPVFKVLDEILQEQYSRLDMTIVQKFVESLTKRTVGNTVHLSNGKTGEIVFCDMDQHTLKLFVKLHDNSEIIVTESNSEVFIEEVILD